jgi:hypothetical protein
MVIVAYVEHLLKEYVSGNSSAVALLQHRYTVGMMMCWDGGQRRA